ncbi:MAG: helix-turn-helix domain-containing protein [Ignavibacteriales bacterium]|nr:helix-turn-helix domain-containing protein [Ignavibacteriales bacterium]
MTIGEHLRKRRLDLKLFQKDIAKILGVTTDTVTNWEKNRSNPTLKVMPIIINFLCYNPLEGNVETIRGKIKQYRWKRGLSIKALANILKIDPSTLARWERSKVEPRGMVKKRINSLFKNLTG